MKERIKALEGQLKERMETNEESKAFAKRKLKEYNDMEDNIIALEEQLKENIESNGNSKALAERKLKENRELKEKVRVLEKQSIENMEMKIKSEALVDLLEERVKCLVCLEVPTSGPIYSCSNGHLVCASCYQGTNSDCSMCRTRMFKNVSLLARTVLENIEHRCRFDTEGCQVTTPLSDVENHKKICNFRPVCCPSDLCKVKVAFKNWPATFSSNANIYPQC